MESVWAWLAENWISLAAVLIAAAALVHSRQTSRTEQRHRSDDRAEARRVREEDLARAERLREEDRAQIAVAFSLEHERTVDGEEWFTLWNEGTERVRFSVDHRSLALWSTKDMTDGFAEPGDDAGSLAIRPDQLGDMPQSVTLIVTHPIEDRRVVRVPRIGPPAQS